MRALQNCDFCDAAAAGTFEVVPPELEPTEREQRRVVLCTECSTRLETLLEPLFDRLTGDNPTADADGDGATAATSADRSATESGFEPALDGSEPIETDTGFDLTADASGTETEVESPADADRTAASETTHTPTKTVENAASATPDRSRSPRQYQKVIRLLRNREFPMERAAVESLAAGAYDLDPSEVDAIIDRAIENGEFVAEEGTLRRP